MVGSLRFKSLEQVLTEICKSHIATQTIKDMYIFKLNQKVFSKKILIKLIEVSSI